MIKNWKKEFPLTYNSFRAMRHRCNNPKASDFKHYGAKGISVCKRWDNFLEFLIDMGRRPCKEFTLDRINNDKGYTKNNCRWATQAMQLRNYSRTVFVKVGRKKLCLKDAAKFKGLKYTTVIGRMAIGWSPQEAVDTPLKRRRR